MCQSDRKLQVHYDEKMEILIPFIPKQPFINIFILIPCKGKLTNAGKLMRVNEKGFHEETLY
jgi:hypothetical protein|tara:strand:+ start:7 stop:192 length:186 start_codon:yes stop_codon:yes gene_type:complete